MKSSSSASGWFTILFVLALFLVACERPLSREDTDTSDTTGTPAATAPVLIPTETPALVVPQEPTDVSPIEETPVTEPTTDAVEQPEPTATPTATPEASGGETSPTTTEVIHVVQAGETLARIADLYRVSIQAIAEANNLANINQLEVGQQLIIPDPEAGGSAPGDDGGSPPASGERQHVVKTGENLFRIGLQYGFTVDELASYNGIANPNDIKVGQVIRIPPGN